MKPGATIGIIFCKLLRSLYGADKFMALSILFSVIKDSPGYHLKPGYADRHSGWGKPTEEGAPLLGFLDILGLASRFFTESS